MNDTSKPICLVSLNLMPPAPLYLRTLWHYINAVIIIILLSLPVFQLLPTVLQFVFFRDQWHFIN